jgi:hypothetical protein
MRMSRATPLPAERIVEAIVILRGKKVMFDTDLARLYGVQTKNFNRAVKRNIHRFPPDFMFQLATREMDNLRCHFGTSRWGGRRCRPLALH